jgi:hypothetical protein
MKRSALRKIISEVIAEVIVKTNPFDRSVKIQTSKGNYTLLAYEEKDEDIRKWLYTLKKDGIGSRIDVPKQVAPAYTMDPLAEPIKDSVKKWIEADMPKLGLHHKWYDKNEKTLSDGPWSKIAKNV